MTPYHDARAEMIKLLRSSVVVDPYKPPVRVLRHVFAFERVVREDERRRTLDALKAEIESLRA